MQVYFLVHMTLCGLLWAVHTHSHAVCKDLTLDSQLNDEASSNRRGPEITGNKWQHPNVAMKEFWQGHGVGVCTLYLRFFERAVVLIGAVFIHLLDGIQGVLSPCFLVVFESLTDCGSLVEESDQLLLLLTAR